MQAVVQKLKTVVNKIMTHRIKVFILTDSAEMPDEANHSHDTHSWQLTSLQYTSHNTQHILSPTHGILYSQLATGRCLLLTPNINPVHFCPVVYKKITDPNNHITKLTATQQQ
jgi:hypothetical protein